MLLVSGLCQKLFTDVLSLQCLRESFYIIDLKYSQVYKVPSILAMPACKIHCPYRQSLSCSTVFYQFQSLPSPIAIIKINACSGFVALSFPLLQCNYNIAQCRRLLPFPVSQDSVCMLLSAPPPISQLGIFQVKEL